MPVRSGFAFVRTVSPTSNLGITITPTLMRGPSCDADIPVRLINADDAAVATHGELEVADLERVHFVKRVTLTDAANCCDLAGSPGERLALVHRHERGPFDHVAHT